MTSFAARFQKTPAMTLLMALVRSSYLTFLVGYTLVVSSLGVLWSGAAKTEWQDHAAARSRTAFRTTPPSPAHALRRMPSLR